MCTIAACSCSVAGGVSSTGRSADANCSSPGAEVPAQPARAAVTTSKHSIARSFITASPVSSLDQACGAPRPVLHLAGELTAGRVDVLATRTTRGGDDARLDQHLGETPDALAPGTPELRPRERIERYQIELAGHIAHQLDELARVGVMVVDPVEHDVLEGDEV